MSILNTVSHLSAENLKDAGFRGSKHQEGAELGLGRKSGDIAARTTIANGRRLSVMRSEPGQASKWLHFLPELFQKSRNRKVVLYCRVSSSAQEDHGNLKDMKADALRQIDELGAHLFGSVSGVEDSRNYEDRPLLERALELARAHKAILVVPSRCRLIRSRSWTNGTNRTERPCVGAYRLLMMWVDGVSVATLLHPDDAARSSQSKRGRRTKWTDVKKSGYSKKRKYELRPQALLLRETGMSLRQIATEINGRNLYPQITHKTVSNWLK